MMTSMVRLTVALFALVGVLGFQTACDSAEKAATPFSGDSVDRPVKRFEFDSGAQLEQLINGLKYTPEAWQAGVREVPRLYITNIPPRWRDKTSKELDVVTKKRVFFRLLGPLILHSNELIQADRDHVMLIIDKLRAGASVSPEDQAFLRETATAYKVVEGEADLADHTLQDKLLRRIDTLPPSLVLAQAAEESGWGSSRFAVEGNALFGMWTWGDKGVTPLQQRSGLGNYKIAAYETPLQSVVAYMHNLNTHQAYKGLRARRAELRKAGAKVTGWELANTLTKYSERGQEYVDSLHSLMKVNKLQPTDDAYLGDGPTILLVPAGEGAN
jgi:Bax protein